MKRIPAKTLDDLQELVESARVESARLAAAVAVANADIAAAVAKAQEALDAYRDAVDVLRDAVQDVGQEIDDAIAGKSDRWHESERGQAFAVWAESWRDFDPDTPADFDVAELEEPDVDVAQLVDELPCEPEL